MGKNTKFSSSSSLQSIREQWSNVHEPLKNITNLGKKLFFNFLGADFLAPKSSHRLEKQPVLGPDFKPVWKQVHIRFQFGYISKQLDILMDMRRDFISGSVYMIFYQPTEMKFHFSKIDWYEIHTRSDFQMHMHIKRNIQGVRAYSLRVNFVNMEISCKYEISFRSKWPIWNPYRF